MIQGSSVILFVGEDLKHQIPQVIFLHGEEKGAVEGDIIQLCQQQLFQLCCAVFCFRFGFGHLFGRLLLRVTENEE